MSGSTLAALLLGAIIAALVATVALLLPLPNRRGGSAWMWSRRLVLALVGTALLALVGAGGAALVQGYSTATRVTFIVLVASSLVWLPATRRWNARAHLAWSSNVCLFVTYLVFMLVWTFGTPLGMWGTVGALVLWALELFAAVLGCAYLWELCDALGSEHWPRRSPAGAAADEDGRLPFVSLHVPAYEEPPEMVIATLRSLMELDYPNYEVVAIDDNTEDESLWRPVEEWCRERRVKFVHLEDWPGYKSGALNFALGELTDGRAEVVGVVDSDYQIDPQFLRRCAPLFNDPALGFVQSPQDYRDWKRTSYFRRLYYSYKYFFAVSQPSRNERDGAIFAGTMGLIRRSALEDVGGWSEWCITEDAELSLRLLRGGWSGVHVDATYGRGIMPLSFEALKGQRFRWCFGGIQILRMHWRSLLPGRPHRKNRLTGGQRWAYLSGALQWYGDLVGLMFFLFLLGGSLNIALGGGLLFRKLSAFLVAAIPLLMFLGFIRAVALIRRGTGASWGEALGAFFIWQSTTLVVARASVQALFARKAEFLRTPKTSEDANFVQAVTGNKVESLLALAGLAGIAAAMTHPDTLAGPLTAILLVVPTLAFAAAPFNSWAAQRAALPPELAKRRRAELRRGRLVRTSLAGAAAVGSVAAAAALVLSLLGPGGQQAEPPRLTGPDPGPVQSSSPSEGPTRKPSGEPTDTPSPSPTSPESSLTPTPTESLSPTPTEELPPTETPTPTESSLTPSP